MREIYRYNLRTGRIALALAGLAGLSGCRDDGPAGHPAYEDPPELVPGDDGFRELRHGPATGAYPLPPTPELCGG